MYGKIIREISKATFEILYKLSYPYTEKQIFIHSF